MMTSRVLPTEAARPPQTEGHGRGDLALRAAKDSPPRYRRLRWTSPAVSSVPGRGHRSRRHLGDARRRRAVPGCVLRLKAFPSGLLCPSAIGVAGHQPRSEAGSPSAPEGFQLPTGQQGISDPKMSLPAVPCQAGHSHGEQHRLHQPQVPAVWWCWGVPDPFHPSLGLRGRYQAGKWDIASFQPRLYLSPSPRAQGVAYSPRGRDNPLQHPPCWDESWGTPRSARAPVGCPSEAASPCARRSLGTGTLVGLRAAPS